ncbi:MAG: metal-sulfur cluster assembly factor [Nanoarchaeota archaeon]
MKQNDYEHSENSIHQEKSKKVPVRELEKIDELKGIIDMLKKINDPELNVDIWSLELIYNIEMKNHDEVSIDMTFTSPLCPFGPQIVSQVTQGLINLGFIKHNVEVVIDPPWEPSEEVKELLGVA